MSRCFTAESVGPGDLGLRLGCGRAQGRGQRRSNQDLGMRRLPVLAAMMLVGGAPPARGGLAAARPRPHLPDMRRILRRS